MTKLTPLEKLGRRFGRRLPHPQGKHKVNPRSPQTLEASRKTVYAACHTLEGSKNSVYAAYSTLEANVDPAYAAYCTLDTNKNQHILVIASILLT